MDFWLSTLALLIVATVAAYLGYRFNGRLMESNHRWEEHRHLVIFGEKICDELLDYVSRYQQMDSSDVRAEILSGQIYVSIQLMAKLIREHFAGNNDMKGILIMVLRAITSYDMSEKPPGRDWIVLSTGLIIELRLEFSGSKSASFRR